MKKSILNLGKALNKADQKAINGGMFGNECPCSSDYIVYSDGSCSYVSNNPGFPFRCFSQAGPINGLCCE
ncbi:MULTISPECIES: hypothetical protein [unclassified Tenacibaculum]|uniref:hypothetical protein n=1 Tax=unclassified Tenacibaculum TaxID=2635139 RepID=UPI001F3D7EEB|nr:MULTISPECIES: hypothetical protein [unclassified Tenacibaculum]MCF2875524.1 hypothetical protein [Tenacibaculum sp. Cn5-1]MCF2935600.1 hypothetical protein [Tenacibaculum sp. Cn5-34]MCG7512160.1 hypothetical protein [Tenacibaculum sp. Cn5-46]